MTQIISLDGNNGDEDICQLDKVKDSHYYDGGRSRFRDGGGGHADDTDTHDEIDDEKFLDLVLSSSDLSDDGNFKTSQNDHIEDDDDDDHVYKEDADEKRHRHAHHNKNDKHIYNSIETLNSSSNVSSTLATTSNNSNENLSGSISRSSKKVRFPEDMDLHIVHEVETYRNGEKRGKFIFFNKNFI